MSKKQQNFIQVHAFHLHANKLLFIWHSFPRAESFEGGLDVKMKLVHEHHI